MSKKLTKKAELAVTDADKFPIESCRERIARRYGLDAVALSGPCEGAPLADCVCDQLKDRWDDISKRFSGNNNKLFKLAEKLADSLGQKDDTTECVNDLQSMGFEKQAAHGISGYLKAFHLKEAMDNEIESLIRQITGDGEEEELDELALDGAGDEEFSEETLEDGNEGPKENFNDLGGGIEEELEDDIGGLEQGLGEGPIEEPDLDSAPGEDMVTIELPADVAEELVNAIEGYEHDIEDIDGGFEVIDLENGEENGDLNGDLDNLSLEDPSEEDEEEFDIPGETMEDGKQLVESDDGGMLEEGGIPNDGEVENECAKCAKTNREAAEMLRAGKLRRVGQNILKLGPEMSINNTDQQAGGKDLGKSKDKAVEDPKAISDGNYKPEGYLANGEKIQDGGTIGREKKFDANKLEAGDVSGGQKSIMGEGESYPENGPDVPAGSSPLGGEQFEGGNVSTKGTVIATIMPDGIICKAEGHAKAVKVKVKIVEASDKLIEAIGNLHYDGDLKKFALEAGKLAKCTTDSDGICKTDTSKLEGSKFTNDAEKKPLEGGSVSGKGSPSKDGDETKTDTSKLESEKFTNDAKKKPDSEKAASSNKLTRKAADSDKEKVVNKHKGDKKVEEPKALDKSNIHPEGYMAGGKDVSGGDGSVQGSEEKFKAHEVEKGEVSGGESSIMGSGESFPKGGAEVPAGGGQMGNEELEGGNVSTKGTTIAKSDQNEAQIVRNEKKISEARLRAASVIVADMLLNGEITKDEYAETLEKHAKMDVPALQSLALTLRKTRERVEASNKRSEVSRQVKIAGLGIPVVHDMSMDEHSLQDKISELFSINKLFDENSYDANGRRKKN